jgi:hypothetical protein
MEFQQKQEGITEGSQTLAGTGSNLSTIFATTQQYIQLFC